MFPRKLSTVAVASSIILCGASALAAESNLRSLPCNNTQGIVSETGVTFNETISSDGKGSLQLTAKEPTTFRLYEVQGLNEENARLLYRAKVKTKDVVGKTYLEMWVHIKDKGEFFSKGLQAPLSGSNNWSTQEIPFFLQPGQKADYVKLNMVIEGTGTVWVDDINLVKADLK